jgi:hypothetical protein
MTIAVDYNNLLGRNEALGPSTGRLTERKFKPCEPWVHEIGIRRER